MTKRIIIPKVPHFGDLVSKVAVQSNLNCSDPPGSCCQLGWPRSLKTIKTNYQQKHYVTKINISREKKTEGMEKE